MQNKDQVYEALQQHLDNSPVGFPATPSGAHLTVLKHFFTPQEARIAASLSTLKLETAAVIHRRLKRDGFKISLDTLREKLDDMARRGTILVYSEGLKERHYKNAGVTAGGIFDFQVNRLSKELVDTFHQYHEEIFARAEMTGSRSIPQLRTIPVARSIPTPEQRRVSTYDDVRRILEDSPGPFAVANCICRQTKDISGEPCAYSDIRETCLQIGTDHARQYVEMGIARYVSKDEAFEILDRACEAGFILQPENSLKPETICCCCGDCCGILSAVLKSPRPVDMFASNYYGAVDASLCQACGKCVQRCQLKARVLVDGKSTVDLNRCIGCGNCVITCPSGATRLILKEKPLVPPKDKDATYMKILSDKLGFWKSLQLRLKMLLGMRV
ncbi:MAG: 4Fe-4S binding protein [Dehalococcoidales bacterium]|nr:4Fe-4S binding protein [Dehalococcoidales bacterium]